ncbi:TPA_asm: maturation protein, partial [ssRNA phage SRR6960509_3]
KLSLPFELQQKGRFLKMDCIMVSSTPTEGNSTFRVIFPGLGTFLPKSEFSDFHQGGYTSLGNTSVHHEVIELGIVPLSAEYNVRYFDPPGKYTHMLFLADGISNFTRFSAILANVPLIESNRKDYAKYSYVNRYRVKMGEGWCTFTIEDYWPRYDGLPSTFFNIEYNFRQKSPGSSSLDVTVRTRRWHDSLLVSDTTTTSMPGMRVQLLSLNTKPQLSASKSMLLQYREIALRERNSLNLKTMGQLINQAASSTDKAYQVSSLLYLNKLKDLNKVLLPFSNMVRAGVSPKLAADAWLSYYYGARLSAKQGYSIISGIIRDSHRKITDTSVMRSRETFSAKPQTNTVISGYNSVTTYYYTHSSSIINTYRVLRRYGFTPSLSLAWDIIPYSFVVDWLVPIGDLLSSIDNETFLQSLTVRESLITQKVSYQSKLPAWQGTFGFISYSLYDRKVTRGTMPRPELEFKPAKFSGIKVVNGVSLVVQRQ